MDLVDSGWMEYFIDKQVFSVLQRSVLSQTSLYSLFAVCKKRVKGVRIAGMDGGGVMA